MSNISILLKAYYERLYEKLEGVRNVLYLRTGEILTEEIKRRRFKDFSEEKYAAYREACIAFIEERIEAYNPTGTQYTFDNISRKQAHELELQLDWYDSRSEFAELLEMVREKADTEMDDERVRQLAEEIISEFGVFPDGSIIAAYESKPELFKLPDYVVARAIEAVIR